MILYFSGTGNTKFVAEALADALRDDLVNMADYTRSGETLSVHSERPFIFLAPIYAWRWPRVVEELIRKAELSGNNAVYCIATRESQSGTAAKYMQKIITAKGLDFKGFTSVNMPNHYPLASSLSAPEETRRYLENILPELDRLAARIQKGEHLTDRGNVVLPGFMSGPVNAAFYRLLISSKGFKVSDACIGCGTCARRCPMGNIEMRDGLPRFGDKCTWCFGCIQYCPKSAIDMKGRTEGKPRGTCPTYQSMKAKC